MSFDCVWGRNDSVRATKRRGIAILDGGGRREEVWRPKKVIKKKIKISVFILGNGGCGNLCLGDE